MFNQSRFNQSRTLAYLAGTLAVVLLAGCSLPPLHRSVAVETDSAGVPVHASGKMHDDRYTVARGDTLYSIAFRANVDYHQLARWNRIRAPYLIHAGQVLRLNRPDDVAAQPARVPVFETVTPKQPETQVAKSKPSPAPTAPAATSPAVTTVAVAGHAGVEQPHVDRSSQADIPSDSTRTADGVVWRWPADGVLLNRFDSSNPMPGINIAGERGDPVRAAADGVVVYSGNGLVGYGELVIIKHSDDYLSAYGHNSKRLVREGEHVKAGQVIARMGSTGASRNELEFQVRYKGQPVNPLKYLPKR